MNTQGFHFRSESTPRTGHTLEKILQSSFCLKCNNTVTLPEENGTDLPALSVMYISIVENTCFARGVYTGEEYS